MAEANQSAVGTSDGPRERAQSNPRTEQGATAAAEDIQQVVVTIDAAKGEVVKIEKLGQAGQHQELSQDEIAELAGEDEVEELEAALETAYEAGLTDALGWTGKQSEATGQDVMEVALQRIVLGEFVGRGMVRKRQRQQLMRRLLLRRLLLRAFLQRELPNGRARRQRQR